MMTRLQSLQEQMPTSRLQVLDLLPSYVLTVNSKLQPLDCTAGAMCLRSCAVLGLPQHWCDAVTLVVMAFLTPTVRQTDREMQEHALAHAASGDSHPCAGVLLDSAKAHLALKTSLLFEKETLIANIRKKASAAEKGGESSSRLWSIFGRRSSASESQSERQSSWREL